MVTRCYVCGKSKGMHEHHVVPRAYGGLNGPTVDLCASHHTLIHTAALKGSVTKREAEYAGHTEAQKAKLRELVTIIRKARVQSKYMRRPMVVQHTFSPERATKFRELKRLLGASSLAQTLDRCVDTVYSYHTQGHAQKISRDKAKPSVHRDEVQ